MRGASSLWQPAKLNSLCFYQPTRAKNIVTGSGRADKDQIKQAVAAHLKNPDAAKNEHVADAFSIAICHAIMADSPAVEAIEAAR